MSFHEGERKMQGRAGVRAMADRVGRIIQEGIPEAAADFLQQQPMLVLGYRDDAGRVRISLLTGRPGFARASDPRTLTVDGPTPPPGEAGVLAIDFSRRYRMRLNGTLEGRPGGFRIRTREVYSNCPKYIQARSIIGERRTGVPERRVSSSLSPGQQEWIARADTFFIATVPPEHPADASHRGGNRGFVRILDDRRIAWDDYVGNAMFNTLGNLELDPQAALLFVDFETGSLLHLNGRARTRGDRERRVEFEIAEAVESPEAHPYRWSPPEPSPFNPGGPRG